MTPAETGTRAGDAAGCTAGGGSVWKIAVDGRSEPTTPPGMGFSKVVDWKGGTGSVLILVGRMMGAAYGLRNETVCMDAAGCV